MADDLDDDWFVKEDIDVDQDSDDVTSTEGLLPSNPYTLIKNQLQAQRRTPRKNVA